MPTIALVRRLSVSLTLGVVVIAGAILGAPIAASASSTASIAGTVTGADTGAPQANVNVSLELVGGTPIANTSTDDAGNYSFAGLAAGTYVIDFFLNQGTPYANQWYGGGATLATATPVALADGQSLTGLTTALTVGATISGTLSATSADGTGPLNFSNIALLDHQGNELGFGNSDAAGNWTITGVLAGTYTLNFYTYQAPLAAQWWNGKSSFATADYFDVQTGQTLSGFDATLDSGATISGTVTSADPGSAPIAQAGVSAYDTTGTQVGSAVTDDTGAYTVSGLNPGQYTLEFTGPSDANDAEQWWGPAISQPTATYFTVGSHASLTGYDAELTAGATISGTLLAAGSPPTPLENAGVVAVPSTGGYPYFGQPAADGTYSIIGLPAGTYDVFFDASGFDIPQADQWWSNATTRSAATPVSVTTGQVVSGIDATLGLGATITGTVSGLTTAGGVVPAANATVDLYSTDSTAVFSQEVYANNDGSFTLRSIPPGTYTLKFAPQGDTTDFQTEWWHDKPLTSKPSYFTVKAGQTKTGFNETLASAALTTATPTIGGKPKVGSTLTAHHGNWGPGSVSFAYQWLRSGTPIAGATSQTYLLTSADLGSTLSVVVTGSKTGYNSASVTSAATGVVTRH